MAQYDPEEHTLWRWTCPVCRMMIRTRTSSATLGQARQHSYSEHRSVPALIIPTRCLWDTRIKGHSVLVTYDD